MPVTYGLASQPYDDLTTTYDGAPRKTQRLPLDRSVWSVGNPCPMPTLDPYNYPIVASTPADWYRPRTFVSGCENPANSGSSGTGGGSFLYDPSEDDWQDLPHFPGMDPSYTTAGVFSHGAATFHPTGPSGTAVSGSSSGIVVDKYLPGDVAVGATIRITGGTGAGQSRIITAASGASRSASYLPTYRAGSWYSAGYIVDPMPTPTGVQDGDLMVTVFLSNQQPVGPIVPPVGWSQAGAAWSGSGFWVVTAFYKVASSEPANYSWVAPAGWQNVATWAVTSASYVSSTQRYVGATYDSYVWETKAYLPGHRCSQTVLYVSRNGIGPISMNGITTTAGAWLFDLQPNGEMSSAWGSNPTMTQQSTDGQSGWMNVVAQGMAPYTESTTLTVNTPWSVQPDNTSTYAIDSGSFWVWRGNASDSSWRWAKYDIATGTWTKKTSTDAVVTPTFVGASEARGTATVNVPAGVVDGDLLLLFSNHSRVPLTGSWTTLFSWQSGAVYPTCYYKTASSEPASYTVDSAVPDYPDDLVIIAYRNAGTPLANGTTASSNWGTGTGQQTPIQPGLLLGVFFGVTASQPGFVRPGAILTRGSVLGGTARSGTDGSAILCDEINPSKAQANLDGYTQNYTFTNNWWASSMALVAIPPVTPGMSNYGMADPSRQGGIHATTDSSNYIYLGGDAQTSLRRYSVSGDSWSALTAHEPYTRPLRNVGGGMVYQVVDGDPYIFYWCPSEDDRFPPSGLTNAAYEASATAPARFYAYDLTNNVWLDLFALSKGALASFLPDVPGTHGRVCGHNGKIIFVTQGSRFAYLPPLFVYPTEPTVVVQDPTKVDAYRPTTMAGPVRPGRTTPTSTSATVLSSGAWPNGYAPGGTPFVVEGSNGDTWLYYMEHTNTQAIIPLRCRIDGRSWA